MADPTMQTFCCYKENGTNVSLALSKNLNTNVYNTICIVSSILGILGATYQILPRKQYSKHHKWLSFSAQRGRRITVLLAVADLMAALGVLFRSIVWLKFHNILPVKDDGSSVVFCTLSSALVQYFYTATWIWTFCYALDMQFVLKEKEIDFRVYHIAAWLTPLVTTIIGLSFLYIPDANCHVSRSILTLLTRILPNYIVTYTPMAMIMIYNPFLYNQSTRDVERIITSLTGQFTAKEREIIEGVKMKFFLINLVFYVCWIPNLINGILLWLLWFNVPLAFISIIWYIMAALNPLQAFFNCMVYRRWNKGSEKIITPWSKSASPKRTKTRQEISSSTSDILEDKDEALPLLRNVPTTSINQFV